MDMSFLKDPTLARTVPMAGNHLPLPRPHGRSRTLGHGLSPSSPGAHGAVRGQTDD